MKLVHFYVKYKFLMIEKKPTENIFRRYYLFDSRLLTHIVFWLIYYLAFGFIWASELGYFASFFLEFILLPVRVVASYVVIYWLLPQYLMPQKYVKFLGSLVLLLLICGLLQRLVVYAFYEEFIISRGVALFNPAAVLKASLLVNTTVMLVLTIKLFGLFQEERFRNQGLNLKTLAIKADRRTHLIRTEDILFIEGLGNYIKLFLTSGHQLTTYMSIKSMLEQLPDNFLRCHKSFVININQIDSFNHENIQIRNNQIPRSKDILDASLLTNK